MIHKLSFIARSLLTFFSLSLQFKLKFRLTWRNFPCNMPIRRIIIRYHIITPTSGHHRLSFILTPRVPPSAEAHLPRMIINNGHKFTYYPVIVATSHSLHACTMRGRWLGVGISILRGRVDDVGTRNLFIKGAVDSGFREIIFHSDSHSVSIAFSAEI